jgi:hypothetical protein
MYNIVDHHIYTFLEGRVQVQLDVRPAVGKPVEAVQLTLPLPRQASGVHVSANQGHCQYEPSTKASQTQING